MSSFLRGHQIAAVPRTRAAWTWLLAAHLSALSSVALAAEPNEGCGENVSGRITVDTGHLWRPPFGLDRVGAPLVVHVELKAQQAPRRDYTIVAYKNDKALEQHALSWRQDPPAIGQHKKTTEGERPYFSTVQLKNLADEVVLQARCTSTGQRQEIRRQAVNLPQVEAQAQARPDRQINPVDLGTILVPADWLLLVQGQTAVLEVAAIARARDFPDARLRAWFDGGKPVETALPLRSNKRSDKKLTLPFAAGSEQSVLHVTLTAANRELWKKDIQTMIVPEPLGLPSFGAVETKLRYDAPISLKDMKTGEYSTMDYDKGWDPQLKDVVVALPNGTRFVFWRGSSYVPFWAGAYNTGLSYQWAETLPPPDGFADSVEPLMDKELRYGRVQVVESTASRVHVRWSYQSTDFTYKVFGDQATEDFYFYPDGFGTRVLSLISAPTAEYEITEFIVLAPQAAYPLAFLPSRLIEMLFLDGQKQSVTFPYQPAKTSKDHSILTLDSDPRPGVARLYRIFQEKRDSASAIYFSPRDLPQVQLAFKPFYDQGEVVSPGYWGNHWPLGRGATTGGAIDERIHLSPAHISTFPWGLWRQGNRPQPLFVGRTNTIDALGRSREMLSQRWSWLIGKTDATDAALLEWAQSYSQPPSIEVTGARVAFPSYSMERRAMRLIADASAIDIKVKPAQRSVNPVFEIDGAPKELTSVTLNGKPLPSDAYAWDGKTLWTRASMDAAGASIGLRFGGGANR